MVPVVTAPGGYRCIGELNVTFDADGNVTAAEGRSVGVGFDLEPDPGVQAGVIEPLTAAVALISSEVIGTSEVELDGRKPMVADRGDQRGQPDGRRPADHPPPTWPTSSAAPCRTWQSRTAEASATTR